MELGFWEVLIPSLFTGRQSFGSGFAKILRMLLDRFIFRKYFHDKEKLCYVIHKHWFTAYREGCKIAFFGVVTPVVFFLLFPTQTALVIFGIWLSLGLGRFFYEVADWYFDVLLVTNRGVIDLDWRGIFEKSLTRVEFETVIGVSYEQAGLYANLLNFGDLEVEREGHSKEVIGLPMAANPAEAERQVLLAREECLHARSLEDEKILREILSGMVKHHLRGKREKQLSDLI